MALTPEQKEANKRERAVRDRAFAIRRKEYRAREEQLEEQAKTCPEQLAVNALHDRHEEAHQRRQAAKKAIEDQIRALQQQLAELQEHQSKERDAERALERGAWNRADARKREIMATLKAEFPDVECPWMSTSAWDPPAGSDYMERARAEIAAKDERKARKAAKTAA